MTLGPSHSVLLFDLDGTLLCIGGSGRRAMELAFEEIGGSKSACPRESFGGMTDRFIAATGLQSAGITPNEVNINRFFQAYHGYLKRELSQATQSKILPGVVPLLEVIQKTEGIALGLGTGNTKEGAFAKLASGGLGSYFSFGGFGCDHQERSEIIRLGAIRGANTLGLKPEETRLIIIGDTPRDILAAQAVGGESLAVATGEYSVGDLQDYGPTATVQDLTCSEVLSMLLGRENSKP